MSEYGQCKFCGAEMVRSPKTGKIFCSDFCWLPPDQRQQKIAQREDFNANRGQTPMQAPKTPPASNLGANQGTLEQVLGGISRIEGGIEEILKRLPKEDDQNKAF